MTNKELKAQLDQYPDDLEIRIGGWYNEVAKIERKQVSINFQEFDIISIIDENDEED